MPEIPDGDEPDNPGAYDSDDLKDNAFERDAEGRKCLLTLRRCIDLLTQLEAHLVSL